MAIITEAHKQKVREMFDKELADPLQILFFAAHADEFTDAAREILTELAALSGERLTVREVDLASGEAATYGVDRAPSLVFLDKDGRDQGFRFYGAPVGYEFMALLDDIVDVSKGKTRLTEAARAKIKAISQDVVIQVFSTPGWPHCPQAVRLAHMAAMENPRIKAYVVDASEFPELAQQYQVSSVPQTVIDGAQQVVFIGKYPESRFVEELTKAL